MELVKLKSFNTKALIENSDAFVELYQLYLDEIPVLTETHNSKNRCYVTSFLTQYIRYTCEEVLKSEKYSRKQKQLAKYVSPIILHLAKIVLRQNKSWINNNLTSTPLYNGNWQLYDIDKLTADILKKYPGNTIIYKSVEPLTNPLLFKKLKASGYIPLLGRQVYIFNPNTSDYQKKRSFQMDKKLAEKQDRFYWTALDDNDHDKVGRALTLYKNLYLDKHSIYNPIYTADFIKRGFGDFRLSFDVLIDQKNDKIVAVQGIHETDSVLNTSFIGYDQHLPQKLGLYRLMNYELMRRAIAKGKCLHMSSGAGDFKLKRGATASFEYQMIYPGNLTTIQLKIWRSIAQFFEKTVKGQMEKLKV